MKIQKQLTMFLLAAGMLLHPAGILPAEISVCAADTVSGSCGAALTWTLDAEGTLTVSGTGAMPDWDAAVNVPWFAQRSQIRKAVLGNGVTSIGEDAFFCCRNLSAVEIPESVTHIGYKSF